MPPVDGFCLRADEEGAHTHTTSSPRHSYNIFYSLKFFFTLGASLLSLCVYTTFRDPVLSISVLLPDQIRVFMHIYSGLETVLEHIVAVWKRVFFFHTTDRAIFRGAYPRSLDRAAFRYAHICAMVRARSRFRREAAGHNSTAALLHLVKVVRIELAIYEVYPLNFFRSLKKAQIYVNLYIYKGGVVG